MKSSSKLNKLKKKKKQNRKTSDDQYSRSQNNEDDETTQDQVPKNDDKIGEITKVESESTQNTRNNTYKNVSFLEIKTNSFCLTREQEYSWLPS